MGEVDDEHSNESELDALRSENLTGNIDFGQFWAIATGAIVPSANFKIGFL